MHRLARDERANWRESRTMKSATPDRVWSVRRQQSCSSARVEKLLHREGEVAVKFRATDARVGSCGYSAGRCAADGCASPKSIQRSLRGGDLGPAYRAREVYFDRRMTAEAAVRAVVLNCLEQSRSCSQVASGAYKKSTCINCASDCGDCARRSASSMAGRTLSIRGGAAVSELFHQLGHHA